MLQNTIKYTIDKELVQPPPSNNPTLLPIHQKIIAKLDYFHQKNKIPHIIFHGSSGSGKRTIVDQFLHKIYQGDKHKIKSNVMIVNCAQGKGIKFIREELKFFAKTNIQSNNGTIFKTIVLINADYLSRFCEIYVPEYVENGKIINLHQYSIQRNFKIAMTNEQDTVLKKTMQYLLDNKDKIDHSDLVKVSTDFYEEGLSTLDIVHWLEDFRPSEGVLLEDCSELDPLHRSTYCICYDNIKSEYRCEKLLMLYMLDFIFLRADKDVKCILQI